MAEWDRITTDSKGNQSTVMVRDRIQDVAYHVVHFQEAFISMVNAMDGITGRHAILLHTIQGLIQSLANRLDTVERWCARKPSMHNLATPPHAGGAKDTQATMVQPGTPAFAQAAPARAQLSPDHGDVWQTGGSVGWCSSEHSQASQPPAHAGYSGGRAGAATDPTE